MIVITPKDFDVLDPAWRAQIIPAMDAAFIKVPEGWEIDQSYGPFIKAALTSLRTGAAIVVPPRISKPAVQTKPSSAKGPGDVVKAVLAKMGYSSDGHCGCEPMRAKMNAWGYWGCWRHRAELVEWFRAKAKAAGIEVSAMGIMAMVVSAWRLNGKRPGRA